MQMGDQETVVCQCCLQVCSRWGIVTVQLRESAIKEAYICFKCVRLIRWAAEKALGKAFVR